MRKPTFLLKPQAYKTNKLYAQLPHDGTGDMTPGVYAGNGTRVNKEGLIETVATDTPRIDYLDGVGLLLEPTRENQATRSYDFSLWTVTNATFTASNAVAPNGERQATLLRDGTGTARGVASESYAPTDVTAVHTISLFVKFGSSRCMQFRVLDDTSGAYFNVYPDGTMEYSSIGTSGKEVDYGIVRYADGWFRVYVVFDMVNTDANLVTQVYPSTEISNTDNAPTGSIWIWGHQIEQGYFPTSYIQTTGAAVTRAYDEMTLADIFTLGLMSSGAGAFFADIDCITAIPAASGPLCRINSGAGSISIANNTSSPYKTRALVIDNAAATSGSYNIEQGRNRVLFNVFGSGTDVWLNGTRVINDTTDVYLAGSTLLATGQFTKWKLRHMAIWDSPLSDSEAKAITQS